MTLSPVCSLRPGWATLLTTAVKHLLWTELAHSRYSANALYPDGKKVLPHVLWLLLASSHELSENKCCLVWPTKKGLRQKEKKIATLLELH